MSPAAIRLLVAYQWLYVRLLEGIDGKTCNYSDILLIAAHFASLCF
jgi:hypothetical protein